MCAENLTDNVPDTYRHVVIAGVESVIAESLGHMLGRHGYTVDAVIDELNGSMDPVGIVRKFQPDCCIVDLQAAGQPVRTQNLIGRIREAHQDVKVVALGSRSNKNRPGQEKIQNEADRTIAAGALGYVDSRLGNDALVATIERVIAGEIVIETPEPTRQPERPATAELRLARHLTGRERQCLLMLVDSLGTAAMVDTLGVSRTTVRTHLQAVLTKLGVHSRLEAVAFAMRNRLPDLWAEDGLFIDGRSTKPGGLRGRGRV